MAASLIANLSDVEQIFFQIGNWDLLPAPLVAAAARGSAHDFATALGTHCPAGLQDDVQAAALVSAAAAFQSSGATCLAVMNHILRHTAVPCSAAATAATDTAALSTTTADPTHEHTASVGRRLCGIGDQTKKLPLHWAASCVARPAAEDALPVLQFLMQLRPEAASTLDLHDRLPLHYLCDTLPHSRDVCTLRYLIAAGGADVRDIAGMLPLHHAARSLSDDKAVEAAKLLLAQYPGAVSARDHRGRTPLHYAVDPKAHIAVEIPLMLHLISLDQGAAVDVADRDGHTPVHLVAMHQEELRAAVLALRYLLQVSPQSLADANYDTSPFVLAGEKNLAFAVAKFDTVAACAALQRWQDRNFLLNKMALERAVVEENLLRAQGRPLALLGVGGGFFEDWSLPTRDEDEVLATRSRERESTGQAQVVELKAVELKAVQQKMSAEVLSEGNRVAGIGGAELVDSPKALNSSNAAVRRML